MAKYTAKSFDMCAIAAQDNTFALSNTAAAALADAVTATHDSTNLIYITGFTVTSGNPAATVSGTVTLAGLTTAGGGSGTQSFIFVESATLGGVLNVNFPNPIPSASVTQDVVLTCPAIASGAATAVTLNGYRRPE